MKKVVKALLLSLVTMGMATGCALKVPGVTPVNPPSGGDSGDTPSGGGDTPSGGDTHGGDSEGGNTPGGDSEGGDTPGGGDSGEGQEKTLTGISLNESALKKQYIIGEALDLTGLEVIARYSDNSTNLVTDYTTDPVAGTVLDVLGDKNVTVTYQNEVAQFTVNVVPVPKAAWTDDEKALMEQYLYGTVLPFVGDYDTEVYYDEKYDEVIFEGGYITTAGLAAYADVLENAGWTVLDISDDYDLAPGTIYQGLIGVETEAGTRYVQVYFYELNNELNMDAGDPYEYTFPTDLFEELGKALYDTTEVPPAFTADYYSINSIEDSFIYYMYCFVDYEGELDDAGYSAALTEAGWTVLEEPDVDGYYVAVAPDQSYQIAYLYDFDYGDLDIYIEPIDFFPAERVNDFVCLYNGVTTAPFTVPALEVEDGIYFFYEDSYNAYYAMFGYDEEINASLEIYNATGADIDTYITKLGKAGWEVKETDVYDEDTEEYLYTFHNATLTLTDGYALIQFMYDVEYEAILLNVFACLQPFPITEWPADYVVDTLDYLTEEYNYPEVKQDVLPALSGTDYVYETNGNTIYVDSETDTAEALLAKYVTILTEAHYTELGLDKYGDMNYLSPNGEIQVSPYIDEDGYFGIWFTIYVAPASEWPAEEVAAALANYNSTVPAFTGTNSGFRFLDDDYGYAVQVLVDDEEAAIASYVETLLGAGYVARGTDSYGDTRYISNGGNGDLCITVYVGTAGSITIAFADAPLFTWPGATIANILGSAITDTLPAISGTGLEFEFYNNANLEVYGDVDASDYAALLVAANYTELGADSDGDMHYLSPNGQIEVCPFDGEDNLVIFFKKYVAPITEWPTEAIATALGSLVTDVLPAYTNSNKYELSSSSTGVSIRAYVDDPDAAVTAYNAILEAAGYTFDGTDSYDGSSYYLSPNGQIRVNPWASNSSGSLVISIKILVKEEEAKWPAEDVADYLGDDAKDSVPALTGGTGYETELYYGNLYVYVDCDNPSSVAAAYINTLVEDNNFTANGMLEDTYPQYLSPNGEFNIVVVAQTTYVTILITPAHEYVAWPSEDIADAFDENITDVLPAYGKGLEYEIYSNSNYYDVRVYIEVESVNSAMAEYIQILLDNGFKLSRTDEDGFEYYISPNGQYEVSPWNYYGYYLVLDITYVENTEEDVPEGWPLDEINEALDDRDLNTSLPAYQGSFVDVDVDDRYEGISIDIELAEGVNAADVIDDYRYILYNSDFDYVSYDEDVNKYVYTNGVIDVAVQAIGRANANDILYIYVSAHYSGPEIPETSTTFPASAVEYGVPAAKDMPQPANVDLYDTIYAEQGYAMMCCNFEDEETANTSRANYIAALTAAGFKLQTVYDDEMYVSADGSYAIQVDEEVDDYGGYYYYSIYIYAIAS